MFRIKKNSTGQASLEMTAALILTIMVIVGGVKIFAWLNSRILRSQVEYERSRVAAGSIPPTTITNLSDESQTTGVEIDVSNFTALNIFK